MKVTIDIRDEVYKEIESVAKSENSSVDAEFEKAAILLTRKKSLIRRLMNETCDEYNDAMGKLAT